MKPMNDVPRYILNPCTRRCLNRLLDLVDKMSFKNRTQRVTESITESRFPELFSPKEPEDDEVAWYNLTRLSEQGVIDIERTRKRGLSTVAPWEHARIVFLPEGEESVRQWLDRPAGDPALEAWQREADYYREQFQDLTILKPSSFSSLSHYPAREVIARLAKLPDLLSRSRLSLYQASAALFWGDSKALRGKERILNQLFGQDLMALEARPILIEGSYRPECQGLLVVENMDTFVAAADGRIPGVEAFTVLYAQGFKGTASRIREPGMARFYWSSSPLPNPEWLDRFMRGWCGHSDLPVPIYYFGDLDPAGLRIYAQMRQAFPSLRPWQPGYHLLTERLLAGEGHQLKASGKEAQGRVMLTGCPWIDQHVIPVMEKTGLCVDQEAAISVA